MKKGERKSTPRKRKSAALFHGMIFILGVVVAIVITRLGFFSHVIELSQSFKLLGAFVAGIFFTSLLTTPAATVAFYEFAQAGTNIFPMAVVGGLGAVVGDLLIFRFLQFGMGDEIGNFLARHAHGFRRLMHYRIFSITMVAFGAMIIMSPLPDELGLALMQLGHVKPKLLASLSFVFNMFGILLIALIARGLM